jgi:hypothetical protein
MTCTRPFPLAMDGNALNVMRSPKLENHYTFVIDQRAARRGMPRVDGARGSGENPARAPVASLAK